MKVITTKICSTPPARKKKKKEMGKVASTAHVLFLTQARLQMLETVGLLKCLETPAVF